jgi:hypothetical protein
MAIGAFIPQVWAGTMLRYLDKNLVFAQPGVVNRDYEGEITAFGDTVKINQLGPVTVGDYTKNSDISAAQTLTADQLSLIIDQAKYFNFQVDDVDAAQTKPKVMATAMQRAAYAVADSVDQKVATVVGAGVASGNILTPDTSMSSTDAYDHLVELGVKLDENNVPSQGRWAIVPPWYHGLLLKDDRFVKAPTPMGDDALRNGVVRRTAGFDVMVSNNVNQPSANTTYDITAGVDAATSFASQIIELEAYRPQLRFADAIKGLTVYGVKVILPNALAKIVCTKP